MTKAELTEVSWQLSSKLVVMFKQIVHDFIRSHGRGMGLIASRIDRFCRTTMKFLSCIVSP